MTRSDAKQLSTTRLDVDLLGGATVKLDGQLLPDFDSPRLQRLLVHLCSEGGVSRTRLAFDLWPDSTETQARGNLRKLLYDLRRVLPDAESFVEFGPHALRWRLGPTVSVDVVDFNAAWERGDLKAAAAVYGGDLLPACYDDWVLAERDQLRTRALDVLLKLAADALEAGDFDQATRCARRALAVDELNEPAYRLLIRAVAGQGDRAQGIRAYHRCVGLLRRHLGVEPDPETEAVYQSLLSGGYRPAAGGAPPVSAPSVAPLVGRSAELAQVMRAWEAAALGSAQMVLIEGEAGIGKTRLAEEVERLVGARGFAVVRSRSYGSFGRASWGSVIDWIRSEPLFSRIDRMEPAVRSEVARLVPELDAQARPRARSIGDAARKHLLDALTSAVFGNGPILLAIDDLQWCDKGTIELIGFAMRAAPQARVLVLGTVRAEELDDDHPVSALRLDLDGDGKLTAIVLDRLDADATAELAAQITGAELSSGSARQLWEETEGTPLFVVEAARTGLEADGLWRSMTPTVKAVISARLGKLSVDARRLAEVASVVGRSFSVEVLAGAAALDDDRLVDAIDELWRRHIVREHAGVYDFSHDRIREVAYGLVAPARRSRLHASVAKVLEAGGGLDKGMAGVVAGHYEQAGLISEAVEALVASGRRSVEVFALDDAMAAFRRGLALLEQLPAGHRRDEAELALRTSLAVPLLARQGYGSDAVRDVYLRAVVLCERLGHPVDPEILRGLGLAALMTCRFDRSMFYARALLAQDGAEPTAGAEGHYLVGVSAFWTGDLRASEEHLQQAIVAFQPDYGADHLVRYGQDPKAVCMIRLAVTRLWAGRPGLSDRTERAALDYSRNLGHPTTEGYVRMYACLLAVERHQPEELQRHLSAGEDCWSEQGLGYFQAIGKLLRSWHGALTDPSAATRSLADLAEWGPQGQTLHFSYGLTLLARAQLLAEDLDGGRATVERALRWTARHEQRYMEAELRRIDGELLAAEGSTDQAIESFGDALKVAGAQGSSWFALGAAASLVRLRRNPKSLGLLRQVLESIEGGADLPAVQGARRMAAR